MCSLERNILLTLTPKHLHVLSGAIFCLKSDSHLDGRVQLQCFTLISVYTKSSLTHDLKNSLSKYRKLFPETISYQLFQQNFIIHTSKIVLEINETSLSLCFLIKSVRMNSVIGSIASTQVMLFLNPLCMGQIKLFFSVKRTFRVSRVYSNNLFKKLSQFYHST